MKEQINNILNNANFNDNGDATGSIIEDEELSKIRDMCTKIPKIEKTLEELVSRVGANETKLEEHDDQFSEIHRLLNGKADASLKDEVWG